MTIFVIKRERGVDDIKSIVREAFKKKMKSVDFFQSKKSFPNFIFTLIGGKYSNVDGDLTVKASKIHFEIDTFQLILIEIQHLKPFFLLFVTFLSSSWPWP